MHWAAEHPPLRTMRRRTKEHWPEPNHMNVRPLQLIMDWCEQSNNKQFGLVFSLSARSFSFLSRNHWITVLSATMFNLLWFFLSLAFVSYRILPCKIFAYLCIIYSCFVFYGNRPYQTTQPTKIEKKHSHRKYWLGFGYCIVNVRLVFAIEYVGTWQFACERNVPKQSNFMSQMEWQKMSINYRHFQTNQSNYQHQHHRGSSNIIIIQHNEIPKRRTQQPTKRNHFAFS